VRPIPPHQSRRPIPRNKVSSWQGYCGEDPDPNPDSVGVYVSQYVTDETCLDTESSEDLDQDGFTDYCELRLAESFAPTLVYSQYDDIGQEPAFAVKSLGVHNGRLMALVMYMLSEYIDQGTTWCHELFAPESKACGHFGDSEAIVLRVRYEASTMHWVTDAAWFSQHEGYGVYCGGTTAWPYVYSSEGLMVPNDDVYSHGAEGTCDFGSGSTYPPSLEYTGNAGGVPVVHVSISKHANYSTEDDCNGGNPFTILFDIWSDTCNGDSSMTVDVPGMSRNVGASDHHEYFLDCRESGLPALAQFHEEECYWSNPEGGFGGWSGAVPRAPDSHAHRLNGWVFGPL
jgi:hypothetical protein